SQLAASIPNPLCNGVHTCALPIFHLDRARTANALEEKRFERVGGTSPIQVDVRVVAATNRNLRAAVAARQYREDLYFRLSVFPRSVRSRVVCESAGRSR